MARRMNRNLDKLTVGISDKNVLVEELKELYSDIRDNKDILYKGSRLILFCYAAFTAYFLGGYLTGKDYIFSGYPFGLLGICMSVILLGATIVAFVSWYRFRYIINSLRKDIINIRSILYLSSTKTKLRFKTDNILVGRDNDCFMEPETSPGEYKSLSLFAFLGCLPIMATFFFGMKVVEETLNLKSSDDLFLKSVYSLSFIFSLMQISVFILLGRIYHCYTYLVPSQYGQDRITMPFPKIPFLHWLNWLQYIIVFYSLHLSILSIVFQLEIDNKDTLWFTNKTGLGLLLFISTISIVALSIFYNIFYSITMYIIVAKKKTLYRLNAMRKYKKHNKYKDATELLKM